MSKHDYTNYVPSVGDKVWVYDSGSGVRVKGIVDLIEHVTRKDLKPRGKTKRKYLKDTKQGKWAPKFAIGDPLTCKNGTFAGHVGGLSDNGYLLREGGSVLFHQVRRATKAEIEAAQKTKFSIDDMVVINPDSRHTYAGCNSVWRVTGFINAPSSEYDRTKVLCAEIECIGGPRSGNKTISALSLLRYAAPEEIGEAQKPKDEWKSAAWAVRTIRLDTADVQCDVGYVFKIKNMGTLCLYDPNDYGHAKQSCKPITPAEMNEQQLRSIVEGLGDD